MTQWKKNCYQIRIDVFWGIIVILVMLIGAAYFKDELYEKWLQSNGQEDVSFAGLDSKLEDEESCFLCGYSNQSLMGYYRKFDTIGLISLNDWYVLDFHLKNYDENGVEVTDSGYSNITSGNTGEIIYYSDGSPKSGMASIDVTLQEDYRLDVEFIQNTLCQECLDKVVESLEYTKWKNEKKEAFPLCLVDFETLEIYSLQDWHRGCRIRDYWVEIQPDEEKNRIEVEVFRLPDSE